ncbi:UvrD-helicase domain-containing protein [Rhodococcus sp. BP-252]|uniref:UvrD-helicase domain-containing protein n=1 Tax=unclassified Rhodococcus (in: high G+C Gram-positive bacteria) TaxID=192944 RepID=UPI001C9A8225|nr:MULTISPECIES: UvrD-helicase domain-containing protein [unclassified Rhodococcus (in: high G+C Gram-positive bacteria)]MBY6414066.1 UvrD-helicase domain-containing protein [Rhodococcus sp. BP-320]MBY6418837.1 UvrD-helicase domain-containing protein [Rhodococcus sp. BP-321]MBY6423418.1 UvrD-helicase domain-containing protein [Rhodococcus sp. BP-324]MBY6428872.1 UvrD-helicase domain-containing protein [Rhodococcus sp. BP-323]MBY6433878.1 UvrD-helicase domain-containing protein [Rhodococcus sp.
MSVVESASGRRDRGAAVNDFDLLAPLPTGTTVLEASAGTGKTYAIVGLATRYVAEGVADISQLLLVTFSRAATQELRERTRNRFAEVAAALQDPSASTHADALVRFLAAASEHEVSVRRLRLLRALSDFDSGTIATTHSFCQRMLDGLGIAGEREPEATLVEAVDDMTAEVVDDIYLRRYARSEFDPPIGPADARQVARQAVRDRQARLVPEPGEDSEAGHRVLFAEEARAEVQRRKRAAGVRDFDDLLGLLHGVLTDPEHGESACARVRERFRVVLVDEFQDTDPLQWDILRRAFHGTSTLLLVGDPKQAIYAFRGAEVLSYLDAVAVADRHLELKTNWRSDSGLLQALETVYAGAALGHDDIVVHPVGSSNDVSRMADAPPLRVRYLPRTGAGPLGRAGFPVVGVLRDRVADDVAADIVDLLESGTQLTLNGSGRAVEPGDIAVLTRNRGQIAMVRDALDRAGVPSVLAGGSSIFETPSATQWLWFLQALEQPHRSDRVRLAALTPLLGWTAKTLDEGGDDAVADVSTSLREYGMLFAQAGFAAVFEKLSSETRLEARLLGLRSGERHLTDLRHVAQLLNRAAVEESFGPSALTRWLTDRIEDPASGSVTDRSRRLDSDAAAVQLATVHASKGLEFPIDYIPYAWDAAKNPYPSTLLLHDDDGRRVLDVGGRTGHGYAARKLLSDKEEAGEELRLLYVALTRAQCQVVLWWAPSFSTSASPLHRLLFARVPGIAQPDEKSKVPDDAAVGHLFESLAGSAGGLISVEATRGASPRPIRATSAGAGIELDAATFRRTLDMQWRRTSYSALTASAHDAPGVSSEPESPVKDDEPEEAPPIDDALDGIPSPMNGLPAGAAFGTLVHEILEHLDTSAVDLDAEVLARCTEAVDERLADIDPRALADALLPVLRTPLGFGTLADIAPTDHLAELDFELPLAGGDDPVTRIVTLRGIAALMREHLPSDDALSSYADQLEHLESSPLRGYLTGSIDSVLRIAGPRYVVVDYKTNRLSRGDLTVMHFTRERMAQEMLRSHYPLQALLYSVALHRYLRWRQPGYDPTRHLGGVQYHFVRGMVGPETPAGCGVFDWNPPVELVTSVSDLLAGIEPS